MEPLTGSSRSITLTAGLLGVLQSLVWIFLSIICIVFHLAEPWDLSYSTHMGEVQYWIYEFFIQDYHNQTFTDQIVTPDAFHVFTWIYFAVDVVWLVASINILFRTRTKVLSSLQIWHLVTLVVCLYDLITAIILGIDYNQCLSQFSDVESSCADGVLPVLTIAAKGFILWIINFLFAILVIRTSMQVHRKQIQARQRMRENYSIYKAPLPGIQNRVRHSNPVASHHENINSPGYSRHWTGYSPASDSPRSQSRQSFNGSPSNNRWMRNNLSNQKPFVLAPPPKRRQ